jgi:hypothetical protein
VAIDSAVEGLSVEALDMPPLVATHQLLDAIESGTKGTIREAVQARKDQRVGSLEVVSHPLQELTAQEDASRARTPEQRAGVRAKIEPLNHKRLERLPLQVWD